MSNPIDEKFKELRELERKALITFITAGDPDLDTSYRLVLEMIDKGADIIELGVPFSDPIAEGPTIEKASVRALNAGTTTDDVFELAAKLKKVTATPILLMLYINLVYRYGIGDFMRSCRESGVDGLIIPDIPLEEIEEIKPLAAEYGIRLINLVAPTTKTERLAKIAAASEGFIYCVSSLGVTGVRDTITTDLGDFYRKIRSLTSLPLALGFGLSGRQQIEAIEGDWDGYIVGSAIVNLVAEHGKDSAGKVGEFIGELKKGLL